MQKGIGAKLIGIVVIIAVAMMAYNAFFDKNGLSTADLKRALGDTAAAKEYAKYFDKGIDSLSMLDTDNDTIPDIADIDIDNDGLINANDPDVDNDGIPNAKDPSTAIIALMVNGQVTGKNNFEGQTTATVTDKTQTSTVGTSGANGTNGASGTNGANGTTGASGSAGSAGASGVSGAAGTDGSSGAAGANGIQGIAGAQGPAGPQGPRGATGATGATGPQGPAGTVGVVTNDGVVKTTLTGADLDVQLVVAASGGLEKSSTGLGLKTTCANAEVLKWNGTAWACSADYGGINYSSGAGITINAGVITAVLGATIETGEITNGAVTDTKLADNAVITTKLLDGAVTSAKIANGTIEFSKLAANGCSNNQIIRMSSSVWSCGNDAPYTATTSPVRLPAAINFWKYWLSNTA
jgi:hypothetical protein